MDFNIKKAPPDDDPPKRRTTRSNSKLNTNTNATKVIAATNTKKKAPTTTKAAPKKKKQQIKVTRATTNNKLINSSSSSRTTTTKSKAAPKVKRKPPPKTLKSATTQSSLQKQETLLQSSVKSTHNAPDKGPSKVASQHKYVSGDVVAAAHQANLAANKSSIKAALQSNKSKLKKGFERGELAKKSSVDGGSTSSSTYTRSTSRVKRSVRSLGSTNTKRKASRIFNESNEDPLDVAMGYTKANRTASTKVAAAKKKKQPPVNHVKSKSRGSKSTGGCSLSKVGGSNTTLKNILDKEIQRKKKGVEDKEAAKGSSSFKESDMEAAARASRSRLPRQKAEKELKEKPYDQWMPSPKSTSTTSKSTSKSTSTTSKSTTSKSTSTTSKSISTTSKSSTSTTKKKNTGPWQCDFCLVAKFDSYNEEAKKHEECCEARSIVEIRHKEQDKKLGLVPFNFVDKAKTPPTKQVVFAKNSPVFKFSNNTRAATNSLFGLDAWSTQLNGSALPDDIVEAMVQLGKLNLPQDVIKVDARNAPTQMSDINNEVLKAALVGHIRPGDSVRKILYSEGSKKFSLKDRTELRFDHAKPEVSDLNYILKLERYYPLQLTLRRNLDSSSSNHNAHLSSNPMIELKKLDLNKNRLVGCNLYWDGFSNGLHLLTNLKELKLDDNNIGTAGCKALAKLLKKKRFPLKKLSLRQNSINDESIFVLTKALQKNKTLTTLDLYNNNVTAVGWDYVLDLLCNKSGIEDAHTSNHTLKSFGVADWSAVGSSPSPTEPASVTAMLTINKTAPSKARAAKEKVWKTFFKANNDTFDMQPLLEESAKMMPHILAYFTKRSSYPSEEIRFRKLYHILRNWNVPALFDNSSPESEGLGKKISALETKNISLELLVKRLQAEKSQLKQENKVVVDELRGEIQGLKKEREDMEEASSDSRKSKKRRVSPNK